MFLKIAPIAAAALFSLSAFAVEKEITVSAQIDPTVELLSPDGSPLPSNLSMEHVPGVGLRSVTFDAKVFSNDKAKDIAIRLQDEPKLIHSMDSSASEIPLQVKVNGTLVTTAGTKLNAADIFRDKDGNASKSIAFSIEHKSPGAIAKAGLYRGPVRLVVTQEAGSSL